jgi:hypothetical protein
MAVVASVSVLAVNTSAKQITENERTVRDALSEKTAQIQELVSVISSKASTNKLTLEMINYGMREIVIEDVLVDGQRSDFVLKNTGVIIANKTIPKKQIILLETNMQAVPFN